MARTPEKFDFEYFERLKIDRETAVREHQKNLPAGVPASEAVNAAISAAAQKYLNEKFPPDTPLSVVVEELLEAGAKCSFIQQRPQGNMPSGLFYYCKYDRPGHGLMFFVSTIEWSVSIFTDSDKKAVKSIRVGRGATGL